MAEVYQMRQRLNKREMEKVLRAYFKQPVVNACSGCGVVDKFRVWADAADNMAMLTCTACWHSTPAFEMMKPQLNDRIAKELGLWVPNPHLSSIPAARPVRDILAEEESEFEE